MQASNSFKKSLLNHMLLILRLGGASSSTMNFLERKRAVKLSADAALAIAGGGRNWSRSLLASLAKQEKSKAFVRSIIGDKEYERLPQLSFKLQRSRRILRRSHRVRSMTREGGRSSHGILSARVLARGMIKRRKRVLRGLVPGGDELDELSLLGETIDYVISLRAQVDVMRLLARAIDASDLIK